MDLSLLLILAGLAILAYGLYTKFANKQSSEQEPKKEEKEEKKPEITYGKIKLFYGSQSGTASKFANLLEEEAIQNNFQPEVLGVETFEQSLISNTPTLAVFLMATHGEGDPTDNAIDFIKWVKDEDRDPHALNNLKYTVFGLGNTQYEHYNKMGKVTNKFLKKLAAQEIFKYGEGDDNSSLEDDFNDWKETLWEQLKQQIEPKLLSELEQEQPKSEEKQQEKQEETAKPLEKIDLNTAKVQENAKYDFQTDKFLRASIATVKDIRELRQDKKDGSTLHMEIDLSGCDFEYKTAQNLGIFVENDAKMVEEVAEFLNLDLEKLVENPQNAKNVMFPSPLTIREVLTYFCDFQGQLMKKTLKDIAKLSENEENKAELEQMASAKGKPKFKSFIEDNKMTIFRLLKHYNVKPSFDQFLLMTPRLAPRVFTISSSNLLYPNVVHVSDSILVDDLPTGEQKVGVCSQYFNKIYDQFHNQGKKDIKIRIDFRESSFKLPQDQTPVIMVGAGTGVAPFIAFAQDKAHLYNKGINLAPGHFTLYFGCRHSEGDYIFKEELKQFQENNIINNLVTAFSRDQSEKVYVQDRIKQNADETYSQLFEKNATLFICGSMSMGKSVCTVLSGIIAEKQGVSEEEGQKLVKKLEDDKKLIKELW